MPLFEIITLEPSGIGEDSNFSTGGN